jgi:hypothetical protein
MPASQEQLETALRNADAAGDHAAATTLATELQKVRGAPASSAAAAPGDEPRSFKSMVNFASGAGLKGVADVLGIPMDTAQNISNLLKAAYGSAGMATGLLKAENAPDPDSNTLGGSDSIKALLKKIGALNADTEPRSGGERLVGAALEAAPSALIGRTPSVGAALKSMGVAGAGGAAGQGVAEAGGDPAAQATASLIAQRGASARPVESVRQAIQGGTDVAGRAAAARQAGIKTPSPGVSADSPVLQHAEALLAKLPGSAGRMQEAAEGRAAGMGAKTGEVARKLAPGGSSAEQAGRGLQSGASTWVKDHFRATQDQLYQRVTMPAQVKMSNLEAFLAKQTATQPGGKNVIESVTPAGVKKVDTSLKADMTEQLAPGITVKSDSIPGQAADQLRKRIGEQLDEQLVAGDMNKATLKGMYAAVSKDIEASLSPDQRKAWNRAKRYTEAGHTRIDSVIQPLFDRGTPEKALNFALSGTRDGASALRSIFGSLKPEEANVVRAHVVENMGRANPGAQTAEGNKFSVETFVTNWNKMAPEARRALFSDPKVRADMENIARVASDYKQAGRALYNPSGTAAAGAHAAAGGGFAVALMTGNFPVAAGVAGEVGLNNALARAMTNPKFVSWLAKAGSAPPDKRMQYVTELSALAGKTADPDQQADLQALADFAQQGK